MMDRPLLRLKKIDKVSRAATTYEGRAYAVDPFPQPTDPTPATVLPMRKTYQANLAP